VEDETQKVEIPVVVTFWHNGFTVDYGRLRKMSERANRMFIHNLNEG
jgi:hypothetical protein